MKPLKRKEGETQQEFQKRCIEEIKQREAQQQANAVQGKPKAHKPKAKAKKKPRKYSLGRHLPHASSNKQKQ
ncbi:MULTISPECIES: hypothetical protein [Aeromonas]|uniref:hypothetical protein n=1 Tax=Aeromonas TaxID=642 RepID=UPI00038294C6|nr:MULTISPECIES: hypothetical protein [Aeromonas]MBL0603818.1 hypothetical protein [Aeromonas dhakensis]MBW3732455.1 hypothetical protein [Aeromonas dhakensis]QSR57018.1 hypothetical protein GO601_17135 [Aeromonas dhakensis]